MTTVIRVAIDEQNPWPGLGSFDEGSERFFNGRQSESAELRRLALNSPLTVLFGASGLGKTSLVQAGLFPLLRKEHYLPVYIRLDLSDRAAPLIEQVKFALQTQLKARRVDAPAMRDGESLWSYLHHDGLELWSEQNQLLTPIFVFDQFEEVFTLGAENPAAVSRLRIDLADLIENRLPATLADSVKGNEAAGEALSLDSQRYKVVLSFREDFLPAVEGWKRELPSIQRNRLRLLPMSARRAFEAVHDTAPNLVDDELAKKIVDFVAAAQEDGTGKAAETFGETTELAVEPALLSLVCSGLNEKRKAQGKSAFDVELLAGSGQSIISDFYAKSVSDLPERVQRFIENELITERGFRKPCDIDDARSVHGVTDQELRLLVDRRVLRIEPQRSTERVELTHDLLTRVVREHRDLQRERARVRRQRRRMAFLAAVGAVLLALVVTFGLLYRSAEKQKGMALIARRLAVIAEDDARAKTINAVDAAEKAEAAREDADRQRAIAETQTKLAKEAAGEAEIARRDAEQQAKIATSRRLATEALDRFALSADGLAISGALAVESLTAHPTPEGMKALAQVLRLIPAAPEIIPQAHHGRVRELAFSHAGRWMASAGEDRTVILWNISDRRKRTVLTTDFRAVPSFFGLAFSEDGRSLAAGGEGELLLWNTETGKLIQEPILHQGVVRSVAFSPDGQHLATATRGSGVVRIFKKTSEHWEEAQPVTAGKESLPGSESLFGVIVANSVAFLTNERLALAGKYESLPGVWFASLIENQEKSAIEHNTYSAISECSAMSLNDDSTSLAALCGDKILMASRLDTGSYSFQDPYMVGGNFSIAHALSLNADATSVAAAENGGAVHVFGVAQTHGDPILHETSLIVIASDSVAFRPDGKILATGLGDGSIALWPTTKGIWSIRLPYEGELKGLTFSPDEKYLVTAGEDESVRIFDTFNTDKIRLLQTLQIGPELRPPLFSPDGQYLTVLDREGMHVIQTGSWRRLTQYDQVGVFNEAAFSPDGSILVLRGPGKIQRFDTATWQEKKPFIAAQSSTLQFSPDGRWLATTASIRGGSSHSRVQQREVWSLASGVETAWSDTVSGNPIANSRPPQGGSQNLISESEKWKSPSERSVSPDGTWRFSLSRSTVTLQDANSKPLAEMDHDGEVIDAAFSPRGRWLATSSKDKTIRLWPLQAKDLIAQACKLLPRNLTPNEWKELKMDGPYRTTCPNLPDGESGPAK